MLKIRSESRLNGALAMFTLVFATFVIITTEFMIVGLIPEIASDLGIPIANAGTFVTWFAFSAALLGPPMTMFASRCDLRTFLLAAIAIFSFCNFLIVLAPIYPVVAGVRLLQGSLLPAVASLVALAAIGLAGPQRRTWAISQVNMGVVAATVIGVPAGAIVAEHVGWPLIFGALAVLGAASFAFILSIPASSTTSEKPTMSSELSLLRQPVFLMHLMVSLFLFTGMFTGYTYIAPLISAVAEIESKSVGYALMGFGIAGAIGNWGAGRLRAQEHLSATVSVAFLIAVTMTAIVQVGTNSLWLLGLFIGLWGAAHMAAFVITQVRMIEAGGSAPAFALSLNLSVCNIGIGLGAALGGLAEVRYGVRSIAYFGGATAALAIMLAFVIPAISSAQKNRIFIPKKGAVGGS